MGRPAINAENISNVMLGASLRNAADAILRADGDRDHMNKSGLTVEQTLAISDILVCAADKMALLDSPAPDDDPMPLDGHWPG